MKARHASKRFRESADSVRERMLAGRTEVTLKPVVGSVCSRGQVNSSNIVLSSVLVFKWSPSQPLHIVSLDERDCIIVKFLFHCHSFVVWYEGWENCGEEESWPAYDAVPAFDWRN